MEQNSAQPSVSKKSSSKTFLIVLALIVVGYLVYTFGFAKHASPEAPQVVNTATDGNSILITKTDSTKGAYFADPRGMTLYTFDKDTQNVSTCAGNCLAVWPIYTSPSNDTKGLPENIGITKATTGAYMYTWKGMPLYYYTPDSQPGDLKGDGVGGVWHIVKP